MAPTQQQLFKLRGRPALAQSAWNAYATHVKRRNCLASGTECRECSILLAAFNARYTAEEREQARVRGVNNYKDSYKPYDIHDL